MGGFQLQFDHSLFDRIAAALTNFDPTDVGRNIGEQLRTETIFRFQRGESPKGEKWPESARVKAQGGQTLVNSAALRNSITYQVDQESIRLGTDLIYGPIHQYGGVIRAKNAPRLVFNIPGVGVRSSEEVKIPRRQFIPDPEDISDAELHRIADMVIKALVDQIGRA
ncbi:MAG: phage virion morphogenesis protein [Candidatus Neomarinimicrobiota bacterium]